MLILLGWHKEEGGLLENDMCETDPECDTPQTISSTCIETQPCPAGTPSLHVLVALTHWSLSIVSL